jgi:hypothetical protein
VATAELPSLAEVDAAWSGGVLAGLPVKIRSKWRGGRWAAPGDGALRFAVPNEWHQNACDEARREVEQALAAHFGRPVAVTVVVDGDAGGGDPLGGPPAGPPTGAPPGPGGAAPARVGAGDEHDEHIDVSELRDADDVPTDGVDMLLQEFGGGEVIEEDR